MSDVHQKLKSGEWTTDYDPKPNTHHLVKNASNKRVTIFIEPGRPQESVDYEQSGKVAYVDNNTFAKASKKLGLKHNKDWDSHEDKGRTIIATQVSDSEWKMTATHPDHHQRMKDAIMGA
jgi:hypothetical protein